MGDANVELILSVKKRGHAHSDRIPFHPGAFIQSSTVSELMILGREFKFRASDVASFLGITNRHLRRLFMLRLGRAPQEWLDEQRMIAARTLLFEAEQIKEVAFSLGFKDQASFNKHFRKAYSIAPSELKRKMSAIANRLSLRSERKGRNRGANKARA